MRKQIFPITAIVSVIAAMCAVAAYATGINTEGALESVSQGVDAAKSTISNLLGYIGLGTGGLLFVGFLIALKIAKKIIKFLLFVAIFAIIAGIYFMTRG